MDAKLADLDVLVVDCQATGASPKHGSLLELAWCRTRGTEAKDPDVRNVVTALPEGESIPRRIAALTGLCEEDLEGAPDPTTVWAELCGAAVELDCPRLAVAHYARYERAFFADLGVRAQPLPAELICTHEIATRLYPELPRRGLKPLAGYFGLHIGDLKRSASHVEATALVWRRILEDLATTGVETLGELQQWKKNTCAKRTGGRGFPLPKEVRLALPDKPGVYRMRSRSDHLLYVGKATNLKRRVNQYFQKRGSRSRQTLEMLTQVARLDVTPTSSPLEAALLECDEIKDASPEYNRALTADERTVVFVSPNWIEESEEAQAGWIGPLPQRHGLRSVRALIEASQNPDELDEAFGEIPVGWRPHGQVVRDGWKLFVERHGLDGVILTPSHLMVLGRRLYVQEDTEKDDEEERENVWRPEDIADWWDKRLAASAHLIRRSRWLVRLTDATIEWQPSHDADTPRRRLTLVDGWVTHAADVTNDDASCPPAPPEWERPLLGRQATFDMATYDRLRVLTTELRRLTQGPEPVRVCLGPHVLLERPQLTRLFSLV